MEEILQARLPVAPWMDAHTWRLPGTVPVPIEDWLVRDDAFTAQMALRDRLLAERPGEVLACRAEAEAAAAELLVLVVERLDGDYARLDGRVRRPDATEVPLAGGHPLEAAGRLVQEDLLILQKSPGEAEHRLTGGVLAFPSNWTLAEKMGLGLGRIHLPVEEYDANIGKRVQRLLDGLRPMVPIMRANLLIYGIPALFNPRREGERHRPEGGARYVRVERQCLLKLPRTMAVIFSIHTYMVRPEALTPEQRARLEAARPGGLAEGADRP